MMLRLLSILLAIALIVPACSEDSTTNPDANSSSKSSFTVNGSGYSNASFKGYAGDTAGVATESGDGGYVAFFGTTPVANEYFSIVLLTSSAAVGGYQVNATAGNSMTLMIYKGSSAKTYFAGTGSIDIKSWTASRASGTFSGSFVEAGNPTATPLQVTAGKFDVDVTK